MSDLPEAPEWMRNRDDLMAHWQRFGSYMIGTGVMKERFVEGLAALCVSYQNFIDCTTGADPSACPHQTYKQFMDALTRHGLTPASAGAVAVTTKAKPTGLAALKLAN